MAGGTTWSKISKVGFTLMKGFSSTCRNVTIGAAFLLASWTSDIRGRGFKKFKIVQDRYTSISPGFK